LQKSQQFLKLAGVLVVGAVTTTNCAEARHYRHVGIYDRYVVSDASCTPPPPSASYIYPSPNWEPFFRRHVYRYGPILMCAPSVAMTTVISVRY
jgi:hypothetical protein